MACELRMPKLRVVALRICGTWRGFWRWVERFVGFALPRVRDFKVLSLRSFDGRGNYTIGLQEQLMFPEIDYDTIEKIKGMNITICTTAKNDEEGRVLPKCLGFPLKKG